MVQMFHDGIVVFIIRKFAIIETGQDRIIIKNIALDVSSVYQRGGVSSDSCGWEAAIMVLIAERPASVISS